MNYVMCQELSKWKHESTKMSPQKIFPTMCKTYIIIVVTSIWDYS